MSVPESEPAALLALSVACPRCLSGPGERCVTRDEHHPHQARRAAAKEADRV